MRWPRILASVVAAPVLLSSLVSLFTQGEWFAQSAWATIPMLVFPLCLIIGTFAAVMREWRALRWCALIGSFSICFVVGLEASGRLVFRVHRVAVQRSSEQLVPRIEAYRREHGAYPSELSNVSLEEPEVGSARAVYFRNDDGSFGFLIWDPGIAGQSYVWNSRSRLWSEHYEPGWIF